MRYKIAFLFIVLLCNSLVSQELPPIEVYTPKDYGAENQNWGISQSADRHIYVANNKGLLEYNGAEWKLYASPNETIIRSVTVVNDYIYTGCYMEFGFWKRDDLGDLKYTSLSDELKTPIIEDEQIWCIKAIDDWVLFQSLDRIYVYHTLKKTFQVIESQVSLTKMYKVDDSIYFQDFQKGLFKIENGTTILVSDHDILRNNIVVNIYNHNNQFLIETQDLGFFILKGADLKSWDIPAKALLNQVTVYSSIKLKDNSFALGTISNGIIHLTENGEANYKINQINGLSNNTVLSLFEDAENNIWLGLDNGVNCVNITSPYTIYNDDKGEIGTIYASAVYNDNLYLGTNQGLFVKPVNSNTKFEFIEGTKGQVWCLVVLDNTLFCGHNSGTYIVENNQAELISRISGTWDVKPIKNKENLLLQGNYNGLNILEKKNNTWSFRNKIEGFNNSSKYYELTEDNTIFVSHEYKGVFKIKVSADYYKALEVVRDTSVDKGANSSLLKYNDQVLYVFKKGVYKYNKTQQGFVRDSVLSGVFNNEDYTSGKLISDKKTNMLWGFSKKNLSYITPGKFSGSPKINKQAFPSSLRKGMTGYENITRYKDHVYLFGSSTGYTIIDLDKFSIKQYSISINTIKNQIINAEPRFVPLQTPGSFTNKENNFEFNYSIPEFDKYLEPEYQYKLEGIYNDWSSWANTPKVLFKNLPYGNYTFIVRGRVGNTITNNAASYSFVVDKPWYMSNLAFISYALIVLLFSLFMHNVYKVYYNKQRDKLLLQTEQELELKELENKQQLMHFENEKLQQDVESKSRELAISTMNLIKKNEFLNSIKDKLKTVNTDKTIKSVIRIIDKNLNNTDDWKFFEEAFNNADKDFLKKVKAKHPSLTPNDLKLCAYLRLNLSSKEIAPLLNISSKSVEVKRYRLRKKMNLPHEASLTNYILEI
ncbi:triple tyrosine motif-containing protein [Corallibacter sp.]|uniref:helix-turn-helix and ligand-binding sensor domain-containing protein n=1 Tax=Corallibacter sp. TaxID=2038084 RepID=UPI003A92B3FC